VHLFFAARTINGYMNKISIILSAVIAFAVCGCHTVHKAEDTTVSAAKTTGHAVGHATEKVGDSVAHGGKKLEKSTEQ
jgi:hypothetical protein